MQKKADQDKLMTSLSQAKLFLNDAASTGPHNIIVS